MTAHETLLRYEVTTPSVPRSRSNGLWSALAATTAPRSAAGSGLAEPERLGQPISVDDMFGYAPEMAESLDAPSAA